MIVVFLHVGADTRLPEIMVRSVRRAMRGVTVVQMTDSMTPTVSGVDERQELPYDGERLMTYRLEHLARLPAGELLILDTDTVVQTDVRGIFEQTFDVALTRRTGRIVYGGKDVVEMMPYNTGVMFSRSPAFWREAADCCAKAPAAIQKWWGDQVSVRLIADSKRYDVLELPTSRYNYSPREESEDVSRRAIVHYKGKRKEWMLKL